ncbi:MAG TPA: sugar phosphate isomerase/epimerase family protein [Pirellulales bacterium]|nr:sugar phosphate isomerase/epimerase family protein [Pirellulales bacterium]
MTASLSRRTFLGVAAGAAGCAWVGRALRAAEYIAADGKPGGFLLGIQSYSLRHYKVEEALRHVHEFGLHSIEFFDGHFSHESSPAQIDAMKKRCAALDIKILGHGVDGFGKDHEANRKYFEFAKRAGIRNLSADPSEDAFDSLDKLVAEYDIRIAIHNHGPGARYDKIADVLNAVKGRHKNIGACADLGHYIRSAEDPIKAITLLQGRLFGIHLKDFAEPRGDAPGVILGKGQLDVDGVFQALKKVKFPADGCLSLEYEEHPDNPLADIRECLAIATEAAKKVE